MRWMGGSWVATLWLVRTRNFSCEFMAIWAQAAGEVLSCGTCVCKICCMSPLVKPQDSIKSLLGFSFGERDKKQSRGNAEDEKNVWGSVGVVEIFLPKFSTLWREEQLQQTHVERSHTVIPPSGTSVQGTRRNVGTKTSKNQQREDDLVSLPMEIKGDFRRGKEKKEEFVKCYEMWLKRCIKAGRANDATRMAEDSAREAKSSFQAEHRTTLSLERCQGVKPWSRPE